METVTFFYLAKLFFYAALCYVLFYGYGLVAGRITSLLNNISGGFIFFLAVNEVIALPFILLHWSFYLYFVVFLIFNLPLFVYGLYKLMVNREMVFQKFNVNPILVLLLLLIGYLCLFTQFYAKYDADDSFYVGLVNNNLNDSQLYSLDPATGNSTIPLPKVYALEGWELMESSLAKIFQLSALEFTHGLMPVTLIPLVFVTHHQIYKKYFKDKKQLYLASIFLGLFFVFSGYSIYSQGTFLLTRSWQGKTILATLLIPSLIFALDQFIFKPKKRNFLAAIFIINLAGIAVNPAAVYLNLAAISIYAVLILAKTKLLSNLGWLILTCLPLVAAGGLALYWSMQETASLNRSLSYAGGLSYIEYLTKFFGPGFYFFIFTVGLFLYRKTLLKDNKLHFLVLAFPALLFFTFLNPLFFNIVKSLVATTTYWRFLWLIPMTIFVPIVGVKVHDILAQNLKPLKHLGTFFSLVLVTILFAFSGTPVFNSKKYTIVYDATREKIPEGISGVAHYFQSTKPGLVLASAQPAAYMRNFPSQHTLLVARHIYISFQYPKGSSEYQDLVKMFSTVNINKPFDIFTFNELAKRYKVRYIVTPANKSTINEFQKQFGYRTLYSNDRYSIIDIGI